MNMGHTGGVDVLSILLIGLGSGVFGEVLQSEDGSSGSITFQTPTLNDEDAHSMHMPNPLKCDACTAITFQLAQGFSKVHAKRPSIKTLPESDVLRIVEEVCDGPELAKYGVKQINKLKRLSGPGLETVDSPGIMAGGGKWPDRMKRMCTMYVGELDENTLYTEYQKGENHLHNLLCKNEAHLGLTDVCEPSPRGRGRGKQSKPDQMRNKVRKVEL